MITSQDLEPREAELLQWWVQEKHSLPLSAVEINQRPGPCEASATISTLEEKDLITYVGCKHLDLGELKSFR